MKPGNFGTVLAEFFASRARMPFVWGGNDCVTFPADLQMAAGLPDFIASERGSWANEFEAATALNGTGSANAYELAQQRLEACPVAFAGRGDVAVVRHDGKTGVYAYSLGIFAADGRVAGPGAKGIVFLPRSHAIAAFRLG